jgi:hypothetical protein
MTNTNKLRPFSVVGTPGLGATIDPSVAIDLADKDRGFLPNRLTTAQRNAIASPAPGLLIYNTDIPEYEFYDGSAWTVIGGRSASTLISTQTVSLLHNA